MFDVRDTSRFPAYEPMRGERRSWGRRLALAFCATVWGAAFVGIMIAIF